MKYLIRTAVVVAAVALGLASVPVAQAADPPVDSASYTALWTHSGLGLDDPNQSGNGGIYTQNSSDIFTLVATCDGCHGYYLVNTHNKCMTVTGASQSNGAAVNQYTCLAGASNQWVFFDSHAYNGFTFYSLRFAHSDKCAEVWQGNVWVGAEVRQNTCRTASDPLRFAQWVDLIAV